MRNFFRTAMLSIAMLTLTLSSQAQVITAEQAQEIAEAFFAQGFKQTRSVAPALQKAWDSSMLTGSMQTRSAASDDPTFHAFTGSDGKGFVIVAGQETGTQIIGYSMDGTLPTDGNLPEGLTDYLTDIDNQVRAVRASGTTYTMTRAAATPAQYGTPVVELNTATWNQTAPFNNLCFTTEGYTAYTGCVPTAYAILMHYYKWPTAANEATVYHSGTGESMVLGHEYDWENMLSSYSSGYTDEQATAVATLMRDLGWAYQVAYGTGGTESGSGGEGAAKLISIFKYKSLTPSNSSGNETMATTRDILANDDTWKTYIKQSLDEGHPIPYSAYNQVSKGRHIFICDGYTDNDYYHFNWGWGGSGNGYFTVDNMVVDASSDYTQTHKAYFMLMPDRGDVAVTATASPATGGTATVNGEASATIADGTQITLVATPNSGYTFLNWTLNGNVVSTSATYTPYLNGASDYVANFAASSNVCTVTVASNGNGSVSIDGADGTTYTVAKGTEVTVRATPNSGYSFSNWEYGTNSSTEATHTFTVTSDVTVTATFLPSVTVNVGYEGVGSVSIDGTDGTSLTVAQGTSVTVRATETGAYEFYGWYINDVLKTTDVAYTFTADANTTLTAKFVFQEGTGDLADYTISTLTGTFTNASGSSVTNDWASTYTFTTSVSQPVAVTLTSTQGGALSNLIHSSSFNIQSTSNTATYTLSVPAPYQIWSYSFQITNNDTWYDKPTLSAGLQTVTLNSSNPNPTITVSDVAQSSTSFTITGGDDYNALAISNFTVQVFVPAGGGETPEPTQYTVSATGDTNGSVTINDSPVTSVTVDEGTEVTLVATPNSGYEFAGWYDGTTLVHSEATYSFIVSADVDLTATYRASVVQYTVSAVAGNGGSVTINSNAVTSVTVDAGTEVTLVATPNDGYEFTGWYIGTAPEPESTEATYVVTANSALSYVAQFAESAGEGGGEGGEGEGTGGEGEGVKYYRIKSTSQSKYLHIESYNENSTGAKGAVGLAAYAEDDEDQIFSIEDAGNNSVYLVSKNGYYIVCRSWNVDACNDGQKSTLTMDYISETEFRLMNGTYYFKVGEVDGQDGLYYPYCNGGYNEAETWVLEEIATEEPTPDPAGINVVSVSQTLDGENDENYIDGILIEFSQDITVDWGETGGTGTGGTGDTGTGTSYLRVRGTGDVSDVNNTIWTTNATIVDGNTLRLPLDLGSVINRTGVYTLTFPEGIVTGADGSEYAGETFTFTVDAPPVKIDKKYSDYINQFTTIDVDFYDAIALAPESDVTQLSVRIFNTNTEVGTITVASGVAINGSTLTLTMDTPLAPTTSTKYSITIPDNLIARAGNLDKVYGGTTIDFDVKVPVVITDITPATGSVVEEVQSIAVTYSYEVTANGSYVNNVKLVNTADQSEIALNGSVSGNVLTLTPSVDVPAGTYTLSNLKNAVYDNVDNGLVASDPAYTITVEKPLAQLTVVGFTPTDAVASLDVITVEFSDEISGTFDIMGMDQIYLGSKSNGCSFEVSGNTLTITPFNAITAAGEYALYIPSGLITRVADGSAVTLSGKYVFTVEEAVEPEPEVETTDYIIDANGSFTRWSDGSETTGAATGWNYKWSYITSVTHPAALTMTETKYKKNNISTSGDNVVIAAGDASAAIYLLSVPAPYKIKSYSFDAQSKTAANTIAPSAGMGTGQQITTTTTGTTHFSVTDVDARSASFTVNGSNNNITCTNFVVQVYVDYGNAIYTMETSRGWLFYDSSIADGYLASTARNGTYVTGSDVQSCQWVIYTSPNTSQYYIYNVGAGKFIGQQTENNKTVPVVAEVTNPIYIYNSEKNGYPFVFSTDDYGAINHSTDQQKGIVNWRGNDTTGGLRSLADDGSAHRLNYVGETSADMLETIRVAVCKYEGYPSLTDEQRATAKALVDGWGGVGYPVASAIEEYLAAVDAANHAEDITAAQTALLASEIQLPEDGKAYYIKAKYNDGTYRYIYRTDAGKLQVNPTDNAKPADYAGIFVFRSLESGKYALAHNSGEYMVYYADGKSGAGSHNDGFAPTYELGTQDAEITFIPGGSVNATNPSTVDERTEFMGGFAMQAYNNSDGALYYMMAGNPDFHNSSANSVYYQGGNRSSIFCLEEVAYANTPTLNSISGSTLITNFEQEALATFSAPFPTVLPEGVTAFYAKRDDCNSEVISLTAYEGDALPANQGFILAGDAATITMVPAAGETTVDISGQNVMGHSAGAAKELSENSGYILANGSQGPGFYATGAGTLAMNKAYLALTGTDLTGMRSVVIRFPGLTDMDRVTVDGMGLDDAVIYDLSGRRVDNPSRGIYIVNGKKVLIK
ncbi:MAG: C10 family peptidase [Bacteroidaceae bacterium]|nr:C10 family peptidase [Bacteroidaceae bacterium]